MVTCGRRLAGAEVGKNEQVGASAQVAQQELGERIRFQVDVFYCLLKYR